jgi:hypothetical protein
VWRLAFGLEPNCLVCAHPVVVAIPLSRERAHPSTHLFPIVNSTILVPSNNATMWIIENVPIDMEKEEVCKALEAQIGWATEPCDTWVRWKKRSVKVYAWDEPATSDAVMTYQGSRGEDAKAQVAIWRDDRPRNNRQQEQHAVWKAPSKKHPQAPFTFPKGWSEAAEEEAGSAKGAAASASGGAGVDATMDGSGGGVGPGGAPPPPPPATTTTTPQQIFSKAQHVALTEEFGKMRAEMTAQIASVQTNLASSVDAKFEAIMTSLREGAGAKVQRTA